MLGCQIDDNFVFENIDLFAVQVVTSNQWSVCYHNNTILLGKLHQSCIGEIRMNFDLKGQWLDLTKSEQLCEQLAIKI
jgi:hypothetical protein